MAVSGTNTFVTVSGSADTFKIDAVQVGDPASDGDYRQILVVGDFNSSSIVGSMAHVNTSALYVSAQLAPGKQSYLTASSFNLSAGASFGSQATTPFIDAPGSGYQIVVYGFQVTTRGSAAAAYGQYYFHGGTNWETSTFWGGQHIGKNSIADSVTFPYGVALAENVPVSYTQVEGSAQIYAIGTIYYRSEAT